MAGWVAVVRQQSAFWMDSSVVRDVGRSRLHYAEREAVCAEPWAGVGCESLSMQMEASRRREVS